MPHRLAHIKDWLGLARQAQWSVLKLARLCQVSDRTLERYFLDEHRQLPHTWLANQRHQYACELLREGHSVKFTASQLGYQHANSFSRAFKNVTGQKPTEFTRPDKNEPPSPLNDG